jgi:hypothetical protein
MMRGSRMLRRALILGGLCVVVAAVGSVGWAMTSANDKLVACAKKSGGALRLVTAAKDCRKTERAVTWSQQGPRGLPGPRGVAGENGLDGEDGIDGEDGFDGDDGDDGVDGIDGTDATVKWHYAYDTVMVPNGASQAVSTACPAATPLAVNGGYRPPEGAPVTTLRVTASAPDGGGTTATKWRVQFENTSGGTLAGVTTWVLCSNGTAG